MAGKTRNHRTIPGRGWHWSMITILMLWLALAGGCADLDAGSPFTPALPGDSPEAPENPVDPADRTGEPEVVVGCDYSLPDWVVPEEFAGYINHPDRTDYGPGNVYRGWWMSWAKAWTPCSVPARDIRRRGTATGQHACAS